MTYKKLLGMRNKFIEENGIIPSNLYINYKDMNDLRKLMLNREGLYNFISNDFCVSVQELPSGETHFNG